jgi:hypothetical protein
MAAQITQIWLAIIEIKSEHPATPNGGSRALAPDQLSR